MTEVIRLETERLILRKFEEKDIADLYEYRSDEETVKFMEYPILENIEEAREKVEKIITKYLTNERLIWAIELKDVGKMIGAIEFVYVYKDSKCAEIGYALNRNYWHKGYAKEATREILKFAFENMKLVRVQAKCLAENIHSADVMKSVGMEFEGIGRKNIFRKGKHHDIMKYAIIDDDYFKNKEK